jgi:hypothetical protein
MAKKGGKRPGGGGGKQRKYTRDNNGRFASTGTGATARGGRLKTASGNKRKTQTIKAGGAKAASTIKGKLKRDPGAAGKIGAAKPTSRKDQLAAGAKKRNAQADRIDAKVKKLEGEYRSKDAAFYTQGVKPAGRDRMIAKSQQAAQLREQSAALRSKAANAERMSSKIKNKPTKSSGGNARLGRAIKNEAAGSTSYSRNPKGYQKRITALTAQQIYKTGDFMAGISVAKAAGKGFRLPRNERSATKAAAAKPAKRKAIGAISEAKAGRIISRIDANRPGLRKATGSTRKTQNSIRTQGKATDFALAAGARARKQGKSLSVNESLQRGVKNAAAKSRKLPKAVTPAAPKAAKSSKSKMRTTKRTPLASDSSIAKRLAMFKSDKQLTDQRTKSLRAGLKKETNSVEKIKTSSAISESQLKSKSYNREITRMEARPIMGKRAGGRGDKPVSGPKAKRPNTIKGKPKRDAKVASKVKAKINLNAGRYKNIYINSANQKGKAAAKPKPRPMR